MSRHRPSLWGPTALVVVVVLVMTLRGEWKPAPFDLQSHRGGRGETTEESLRAFTKSLELGVTTLELDIVLTMDGKPLVWHDPRIDPAKCTDTAGHAYVGKLVRELTLEQIRTLECGKRLDAFPEAEVVSGNRIATLPEVFALVDACGADVGFNIETKIEAAEPSASATPQEFVDVILAAVRAAGKTDKVMIQSFDWRTFELVRRAEPSIPLVALWDETSWAPGSPWLAGVDPGVTKDPIAGAKLVGAHVLSPGYSVPYGRTPSDPDFRLVADAAFIGRAHGAGLRVIPWTINDPAAMHAQIAAGADGIITDYPTRLRRVMAERGMPLPRTYRR